jgi:hypothetical protein
MHHTNAAGSRRRTKSVSREKWYKQVVTVFVAFIMVDIAALISLENSHPKFQSSPRYDTSLMPSQVQRRLRKNNRPNRKSPRPSPSIPGWIVPSQVLAAHPTSIGTAANDRGDMRKETQTQDATNVAIGTLATEEHIPSNSQNKRSRRRKRNKKRGTATATNNSTSSAFKSFSTTGNLPDIQWRHIPMEHLRHHPNFVPLPPPESITCLSSLEDVRRFRQESWQWDELHAGRCTTSQAVAALGFLEPLAAEYLGIPRGWRRGGQGAFYRLSKPALRTLEEMSAVLCGNNPTLDQGILLDEVELVETTIPLKATTNNTYWSTPKRFPFAAKYTVPITEQVRQHRRNQAKVYTQSPTIQSSIRMLWGNIQEATALLTAVNYFWKQDRGIVLKEVGMCGAGLALNHSTGLLVGATPDALLVHPDGTVEAVEVKNHCPFIPNSSPAPHSATGNRRHKTGRFRISRMELSHGVMPQYVPQLMMEMLCVGQACKSAIMVRQTALNGALILRVHRDDEWIDEMVYWLNRFHDDFVSRNLPPPPNFFYESDIAADRTRYKAFLEFTKRLESKVEVLAHVPNDEVQRAVGSISSSGNLFLD